MISFFRVLFWSAILFIFVMAVLPHPPRLLVPSSDKVQHIVAFVTLAWLAAVAYPKAALLKLFLMLSVFGAFIEVAQAIPGLNRFSDPVDWAVDLGAAAVALMLVRLARGRQETG